MSVLTVNAGSSSVRLSILKDGLGGLEKYSSKHVETVIPNGSVHADPDRLLKTFLKESGVEDIRLVAHRVVHGGAGLTRTTIIDDNVESEIERLSSLAPLHNPAALGWIKLCRDRFGPKVPNVAVFDTAFFSSMPDVAKLYALPGELAERYGVRRYGFHGTAHDAMLSVYAGTRGSLSRCGRVISLQLGAGCSVTASREGRPVDTSMGFSPVEGLVMATRPGDFDPAVVTFLQRAAGMRAEEVDGIMNTSSGLLGVSGLSADMRELLASKDPMAERAVELFCYRAKKYIGSYLAVLGGAEAVIFGGGIGENAPEVRERILAGMEWCGIELDSDRNGETVGVAGPISADGSGVEVWVIPVDESYALAAEALGVRRRGGVKREV